MTWTTQPMTVRLKALAISLLMVCLGAGSVEGASTVQYTYDAAGRLKAADFGGDKVIVYQYDLNGNLLNRTAAAAANADLRLTKSSDFAAVTVGFDLNFTLTVTNAGPDAAAGVVVTDPLPFGLVLNTATASQGNITISNNTLVGNLGVLLAGSGASIQFSALPAITNRTTNVAMVVTSSNDPNPANNTDTQSTFGLGPIFDSDGDQMPNWWEQRHGLNPFSAEGNDGPDGDLDGDGVSNFKEWQADTRPDDPDSFFVILNTDYEATTGEMSLTFQSSNIRRYLLEFTADLAQPFTPVSTHTGTGAPLTVMHNAGTDSGFYRIQAQIP